MLSGSIHVSTASVLKLYVEGLKCHVFVVVSYKFIYINQMVTSQITSVCHYSAMICYMYYHML